VAHHHAQQAVQCGGVGGHAGHLALPHLHHLIRGLGGRRGGGG
jgi:hypothetical protein